MAFNGYSSNRTPRFYINILEYLNTIGFMSIDNVFRTLPVKPKPYSGLSNTIPSNILTTQSFVAFLGHDFATSMEDTYNVNDWGIFAGVVNSDSEFNGYSISTFNGTGMTELATHPSEGSNIGSIVIGNYYQMPHSSDLNLSMDFQTGSKLVQTKGGATLNNQMWRPPLWGTLGPWELQKHNTTAEISGHNSKRSWNLTFSYLAKDKTFPKYHTLSRRANEAELSSGDNVEASLNINNPNQETLLDSDDFFTQVWNRVGSNPFIFQPDKDTAEFAIARFSSNSLSVTQVSNDIYTIKLKINESF